MAIRKREWSAKDGKKAAWVVDYKDQHGKRRLKTFAKKKDADAWWNGQAGYEVARGLHTAASASITVQKAGDAWVKAAEKDGLEASTVRQYRQHLDLHIKPFLGSVKLSDLSAPMVKDFETWLRDNGRSPQMVRKVISSLGSLLADALERGKVARNVVRELPRKRRQQAQQSRHKVYLEIGRDIPTAEEINAALASLEGYGRALFLTAARAGLRASELRALRWQDVDFESKGLHVRQRADRWNNIGALKSGAGRRDIPMTAMLVNTLKEWKLAYPRPFSSEVDEDGKPVREIPQPEHLVFPTGAGTVENHGNIYRRVFAPAWVAAGATVDSGRKNKDGEPILRAKYGIHSLRHFFASWLINEKGRGGLEISLKRAQVLLGHASLQMTADVYGHLLPAREDEAAEFTMGEQALIG